MFLQETLNHILKQIKKQNVKQFKFIFNKLIIRYLSKIHMNLSTTKNNNLSQDLSIPRPWNRCLYNKKCVCKEIKALKEKLNGYKSNRTGLSEGKPLPYPVMEEFTNKKFSKTFQIKYEGTLSKLAKLVLNSFQNKYIYYAIDDILYVFEPQSKERENILAFLYSPMLSLHNDFSINFFDIWIHSIYINDIYKENRFLTDNSQNAKPVTYITLELSYITRSPIKKLEPLW